MLASTMPTLLKMPVIAPNNPAPTPDDAPVSIVRLLTLWPRPLKVPEKLLMGAKLAIVLASMLLPKAYFVAPVTLFCK